MNDKDPSLSLLEDNYNKIKSFFALTKMLDLNKSIGGTVLDLLLESYQISDLGARCIFECLQQL